MNLRFETLVDSSFTTVIQKFNQPLLEYLCPAFPIVRIKRYDGNEVGDHIEIHLGFLLFTWKWICKINAFETTERNWYFIDEGIELPPFLKKWTHKHEIQKAEGNSIIVDEIYFEASRYWPDSLVKLLLWLQFSQRPALYKRYFRRANTENL